MTTAVQREAIRAGEAPPHASHRFGRLLRCKHCLCWQNSAEAVEPCLDAPAPKPRKVAPKVVSRKARWGLDKALCAAYLAREPVPVVVTETLSDETTRQVTYWLERTAEGYALQCEEKAPYRLPLNLVSCDCKDAQFRTDGQPCKHRRLLANLLPTIA